VIRVVEEADAAADAAADAGADPRRSVPVPRWAPEAGTDGGLAGALSGLVSRLRLAGSLADVLADVAAVAGHSLSVSSSLTSERGRTPTTLASSDPLAAAVDRIQYELARGPGLETLHTERTTVVPDLRADPRWAPFPSRALALGVRSCLSVPLVTPERRTVAALNLYSPTVGTFDDPADVGRAATLAVLAGLVVSLAERRAEREQVIGQLREALSSRSAIDQAVGVLMAQRHCAAERAMELLRQESQRSNRKVRDLAAEILAGVATPLQPGG
jgi:GAF domain-containing protein